MHYSNLLFYFATKLIVLFAKNKNYMCKNSFLIINNYYKSLKRGDKNKFVIFASQECEISVSSFNHKMCHKNFKEIEIARIKQIIEEKKWML